MRNFSKRAHTTVSRTSIAVTFHTRVKSEGLENYLENLKILVLYRGKHLKNFKYWLFKCSSAKSFLAELEIKNFALI